ncbi:MAG: DUF6784 domain-containing protein, partial [Armatimonadota bacterium]
MTQGEDMTTALARALVDGLGGEGVEQVWSKLNQKNVQEAAREAQGEGLLGYVDAREAAKLIGYALSAAMLLLLTGMRWRFGWWRLHPVGYAASTIWATNFMWFSMLVGSALNFLILRYGGLRTYRRARPFFLGLILGDFLMMAVWFVVDAVTGVRGFRLFGD